MRKVILAFAAVLLSLLASTAAEEKAGSPPALEVVSRFALIEKPGQDFVDLRWAGRNSIYLADRRDGIAEVKLEEGLPEVRRLSPRTAQMEVPMMEHMAVSDKWMVAARVGRMAWKAVDGGEWQALSEIGYYHGFDIRGDEIVMLGVPHTEHFEHWRGGVVWRSDLSKGLSRWEVLYESEEAAQDFYVLNLQAALGSIRYLPRGGFVVAPNFLPGVLLFSASGSLKRQWTPEELWGGGKAGNGEGVGNVQAWRNWRYEPEVLARLLASRRLIDEVLPLPEGPAIVVREPRSDAARYRLGVLGPEIRWYDIPLGNVSPLARLRGDADEKGRIVLAAVERWPTAPVSSSEILVLRLPR
jgi:hypothetical protein